MYFNILIGIYLISSTINKTPVEALKSIFTSAKVFGGFPQGHQKNDGSYTQRLTHRFSIPESGISDLVFRKDRQGTLTDFSIPESGKDTIQGDDEYYRDSEKKTHFENAMDKSHQIAIPREMIHSEDDKNSSWKKDNLKLSWWKSYLLRVPNGNEEGYYYLENEINVPQIRRDPSYKQPTSPQQLRKIRTSNDDIVSNINYVSDPTKGQIFSTNNDLQSDPLLKHNQRNSTTSETFRKMKNNVNDNSKGNTIKKKSSYAGIKHPDQLSQNINNIKFPEKEIISRVYNMIEDVNNLHRLGSFPIDDIKMPEMEYEREVDLEEVLPEAQRRFASKNTYDANFEDHSTISKNSEWNFEKMQFTTISVGSLMLFLILVVMVLALRVHCRNREKTSQEWIRHPVVQPSTAASNGIQPNFQHILHPDHLSTEPIRIKAKGLLERRGSNTSLTIDLGPGSEGADVVFSPSRECTPENFLMTAGSRMSRRQLRLCLRDTRDLHAEFWQIPTNHPEKCSVPGAAAKNRYRTVLPNEETRVVLHKAPPDSPETPASQYINANYIRGYDGEERAYVATQGPLAHTVEDLWLLVLQERSPAVVMITRLKEKGRVKCEPYIPSYAASYGNIHVTVKQVIQKNGYTVRQIYITRGEEVHTTLHYWFTSWPDHKAPSSARHLLAMASEVETARKDCRGPVVVHCSAGIGRTGCFIAVSIGRNQLLEEDCVDILSIVCQMRLDRGGMVQTAEQYEFIHRALALYEASLPSTASAE